MSPCRSKRRRSAARSCRRGRRPIRVREDRRIVLASFFEKALHVIDRFVLAPEHHGDQPLRVELHHHVRAFVDHPEVVFLVEADRVRERKAVGVLPPLLHILAGFVELEELRRLRAARRADVSASCVHEQMLLGVEGDADGLADRVSGRHERQRYGIVRNLRGVLLELCLCGERRLLLGTRPRPRPPPAAPPWPGGGCPGSAPRCA
jgi:hypothetical protein